MDNLFLKISDFFAFHNVGISAVPFEKCRIINERKRANCQIQQIESVITLYVPYSIIPNKASNISVYARPKDYHLFFSRFFSQACDFLKSLFPDHSFTGYADNSFIDERHAAVISGLGVYGKNGTVITKEYGSYVFLGEIVTDLPFSFLKPLLKNKNMSFDTCIKCGACISVCPMKKGEIQECLSSVTQKKGELSVGELNAMKKYGTVWGCDICQNVCPMNKGKKTSTVPFFNTDVIERLTKEDIEAMSDDDFSKRAFAWRGRKIILRNLELIEDNKND